MLKKEMNRKENRDSGFSLVELIIVVSILAIAAVPLMKSMGMATKANARAQSIQNATSLGESIMEDVKSSSVKELSDRCASDPKWKFEDKTTYYKITMDDQRATQGEEFDVVVEIHKDSYTNNAEMVDDNKAENVLSANSLVLPSIEDVDTLSQAVLTSVKELNKYDNAAQSYFNEKKADYKPSDTSTKATISSKTIEIKKKNIGSLHGVNVNTTVVYEDASNNKYVRDLYNGSFVDQSGSSSSSSSSSSMSSSASSSTMGSRFDSNIYIFYTKGSIPETIKIEDNSSPPGKKATDSHKVYFIRQDEADDLTGLSIVFSGSAGSGTFTKDTALDENGEVKFGNITLITNMKTNLTTHSLEKGHIYKEEAKTRVYEVTVTIKKDDESEAYATLKSTMPAY